MPNLIKRTVYTFVLFSLALLFTVPSVNESIYGRYYPLKMSSNTEKNLNIGEKKFETNSIYQDSLLTSEINLQQFVPLLQKKLTTAKPDIAQLKKEFPEITSIYKKDYKPLTINDILKSNLNYSKPTYTFEQQGRVIRINVPIMKNNMITNYKILMKNNMFGLIEKKQQLRLSTVTHLQNNRWKTVPTKYNPSRKLTLSDRLPKLEPSEEQKGISHYIKNNVVVKFKQNVTKSEIDNFLKTYSLTIEKQRDHTIIATCPKRSTHELINIIEDKHKDYIEYVEPHFIYLTNEYAYTNSQNTQSQTPYPLIPNDRLYSDYQWNLPNIYTEEGWNLTKGKENVVIAIVDTGVDLNHIEFNGKLVEGFNVINPNLPPMDDDGHGTHVAGIISANTNNGQGIAGITWYNKIMPIKVLDQSGAGTLFDVAEGIFWATDHGAKVINLSLGNYAESKYLHDAIKYAYSKDVVLVAATGNDNVSELGYPASYSEVIGVSATDPFQQKAEFSNYGNYVDVVAPGVNIASTYPNNQYASLSGTSMASPHVAALAGLIRSINPSLSNKDVNEIIKKTATDLGDSGKDSYYGYGEINIAKAIQLSNSNNPKPFTGNIVEILKEYLNQLH